MANYYRVTAGPVKVTLGNGDTHTFATNDQVDPTGEYYLPLAAIPNMLVDSGTPVPPPSFTPPPPSVKVVDVTSSATAPSNPATDDLWFDTNTGQKVLKRWNGSAWESNSAAYMGIGGAAVTQPVTLTDTAGFGNNILDIEHAANGTGGNAGQTYGINIHNAVGAVSAVVVHQYSQQGDPAIWVDNCGTAPILKLHNTQNLVTAPGQDGTGDFIQLFDHGTATLTWSKDHVLTVSNNKTFTIIGSGTTSKVMSLQTVQDITALEIVKANANGAEVVRIDNQGFGNSVRIQNNGTVNFLIDYQGLIRWVAAGNQQTTVGAAGGASALPATPTKYLKVLDSAGTTLVIPAYAAA